MYIADIILTGNNCVDIQQVKKSLANEFEVKDLGNMRCFLGLEVARSKKGILMSQRKYTLDLLKETEMIGAKLEDTTMVEGLKLEVKEDGVLANKERYQKLVGKLIYLCHTRPNISYAVGVVSQFSSCPHEDYMEAIYRILRYLKINPRKGIFFNKDNSRGIEIYTDAEHGRDPENRRSARGYFTFLWGNLVTRKSKKTNLCFSK